MYMYHAMWTWNVVTTHILIPFLRPPIQINTPTQPQTQVSSTDYPEGLLKSCGWDAPTVASLGDETAHYGRWPFRYACARMWVCVCGCVGVWVFFLGGGVGV